MWDDISAVIKNRVESTLEQTKDFLGHSFKMMYLRLLISLSSAAVICSSVVAFITKLADRMDANEVDLWTRSMSLYVVVIIIGSLILKVALTGVPRDRREGRSSPDAPINRISQRKAHGKRRKSRRN